MSAEVLHGAHEAHEEHLAHHFAGREQQDDSYLVGMWSFLVTEIMFFGALFLAFTVYRAQYPEAFSMAHHELNVPLGTLNTFILLFSSLTMAMGVYYAQKSNSPQRSATDKNWIQFWIGITILCAFGFLGIKTIEYAEKFEKHHVPGPYYSFREKGEDRANNPASPQEGAIPAGNGAGVTPNGAETAQNAGYLSTTYAVPEDNKTQLFFALYFCMTGLHAFHIIIGIFVLGALFVMVKFDHPAVQYFMPIEMAGLYWHFVDIVWIFLFPLLYLLG